MIMKDINLLKENDIYNLILFAIFKFTNNPEYSTISELIYTLDKDGLLKLCSTFGGCTIRVPTITELKLFTCALVIYQEMNINHKTFNEAYKLTGLDNSRKKEVANIYSNIISVINDYAK